MAPTMPVVLRIVLTSCMACRLLQSQIKVACPLTEHSCWLLQALKKLVKDCWDPNPEKRSNFEEVVKVLDKLIKTMPREHASGGGGCCSVQ